MGNRDSAFPRIKEKQQPYRWWNDFEADIGIHVLALLRAALHVVR